jgi:hypothetical protein
VRECPPDDIIAASTNVLADETQPSSREDAIGAQRLTRLAGSLLILPMCNLYSITTNQAAIIVLFRVINRYVGNLPPMPGVFPDAAQALPGSYTSARRAWRQSDSRRVDRSRPERKLPVNLTSPNGVMIQTIANGNFEPMNFREAVAPFLAAFIIAVSIWAALGPPQSERTGTFGDNRLFAGPP